MFLVLVKLDVCLQPVWMSHCCSQFCDSCCRIKCHWNTWYLLPSYLNFWCYDVWVCVFIHTINDIMELSWLFWCHSKNRMFWMVKSALEATESGTALKQRIKRRINVPPRRPTPGTVNPLLSSNLSGIKTSIALLNINVCWTLNTFEPAQSCRIKEVPFKGLFHQNAELKAACLLCSVHTINCFFISIS